MLKNYFWVFPIFLFFFLTPNSGISQSKKIKTIVVDAGHGGHDAGAVGNYEGSLRAREKDITLAISLKLADELKKQIPGINVVTTRTSDIYQSPREKANIANQANGDLFLCIHADAVNLKTGSRQIGTKKVTRHKISYKGKGKHRKKISTPYTVTEPVYEYFKIPTTRKGTSVFLFAAHKTGDKLKAISSEEGEFDMEGHDDSTEEKIDFNTPEGRAIALVYAKRFQEKSDLIGTLVNEEVEKSGRNALGVKQRQVGIWVLQATNMPAILIETGFISNPEDERYLVSEKGQQELAEVITKAVIRYKDLMENPKTEVSK